MRLKILSGTARSSLERHDKPGKDADDKSIRINPKVIIEVLSPATEDYDRSEKLSRYQKLKSLSDYVLISQTRSCVEHL